MSKRWPWQAWNCDAYPGYCPQCWGSGRQVEFLWPAGTPRPVDAPARYVCEQGHEWSARVRYGLVS